MRTDLEPEERGAPSTYTLAERVAIWCGKVRTGRADVTPAQRDALARLAAAIATHAPPHPTTRD